MICSQDELPTIHQLFQLNTERERKPDREGERERDRRGKEKITKNILVEDMIVYVLFPHCVQSPRFFFHFQIDFPD